MSARGAARHSRVGGLAPPEREGPTARLDVPAGPASARRRSRAWSGPRRRAVGRRRAVRAPHRGARPRPRVLRTPPRGRSQSSASESADNQSATAPTGSPLPAESRGVAFRAACINIGSHSCACRIVWINCAVEFRSLLRRDDIQNLKERIWGRRERNSPALGGEQRMGFGSRVRGRGVHWRHLGQRAHSRDVTASLSGWS